jgi:chromate reductase, NAD(P)H dehydrogenase (quinone)
MKTYVAFSGSLRKDSHNTNLLRALQEVAGDSAHIEICDISTLPLFDQDREVSFPSEAQALKDKVLASDGIIFATPEYNRSIPGVLKNAIDWISRPWGQNSFAGKPVLILGASIASTSAALAQYHLKQIMLYLDARVVGQPEFFMGPAAEKFDAAGKLVDNGTRQHLSQALEILMKI